MDTQGYSYDNLDYLAKERAEFAEAVRLRKEREMREAGIDTEDAPTPLDD